MTRPAGGYAIIRDDEPPAKTRSHRLASAHPPPPAQRQAPAGNGTRPKRAAHADGSHREAGCCPEPDRQAVLDGAWFQAGSAGAHRQAESRCRVQSRPRSQPLVQAPGRPPSHRPQLTARQDGELGSFEGAGARTAGNRGSGSGGADGDRPPGRRPRPSPHALSAVAALVRTPGIRPGLEALPEGVLGQPATTSCILPRHQPSGFSSGRGRRGTHSRVLGSAGANRSRKGP